MRKTEFLKLNLPDGQEVYNVNDFNKNFTVLDSVINELQKIADSRKLPVVHGYAIGYIAGGVIGYVNE